MKTITIFQDENKRVVFFFIFAHHLFYVWLNRRQLDSQLCCYIQSVAIPHIMKPLENSASCDKYYYENSFDLTDFLASVLGAPGGPGTPLVGTAVPTPHPPWSGDAETPGMA